MGRTMNMLMISGAMLALVGVAGMAVPIFTTQKTNDVAVIGNLKLQTEETTPHAIPPLLSGSVVACGLLLLAVGVYRKR